jgi:hypothetical protein
LRIVPSTNPERASVNKWTWVVLVVLVAVLGVTYSVISQRRAGATRPSFSEVESGVEDYETESERPSESEGGVPDAGMADADATFDPSELEGSGRDGTNLDLGTAVEEMPTDEEPAATPAP